jgi:hypothetical protein
MVKLKVHSCSIKGTQLFPLSGRRRYKSGIGGDAADGAKNHAKSISATFSLTKTLWMM